MGGLTSVAQSSDADRLPGRQTAKGDSLHTLLDGLLRAGMTEQESGNSCFAVHAAKSTQRTAVWIRTHVGAE